MYLIINLDVDIIYMLYFVIAMFFRKTKNKPCLLSWISNEIKLYF